mmetsp:Transcript_8216/g.10876  ORF Transcript_8216/g.10876 Transcript_8216/m.10876 type:complete len:235 (+) Transcript_8216:1223-1927(+)
MFWSFKWALCRASYLMLSYISGTFERSKVLVFAENMSFSSFFHRSIMRLRVSPWYSFTSSFVVFFISFNWVNSEPIKLCILQSALNGFLICLIPCLTAADLTEQHSISLSSKHRLICISSLRIRLHRSISPLTSWFPERSSIISDLYSLSTRLARIGVKSPSSSNRPFVKAAAVFITRPSLLVRIFRSCLNVLCNRSNPPPPGSGYIKVRKSLPTLSACCSPAWVSSPPHFTTI